MKCPYCNAALSEEEKVACYCVSCDNVLTAEGDSEQCPHCGVYHERGDDGFCNQCGGEWPEGAGLDSEQEKGAHQAMSIEEARSTLETLKKAPATESYERMLAAQEADTKEKERRKAARKSREALDKSKGDD